MDEFLSGLLLDVLRHELWRRAAAWERGLHQLENRVAHPVGLVRERCALDL